MPTPHRPTRPRALARLACATAFKRFFSCAYILLKVEAHSRPGKIIIAKIKLRGPGPAGLHFIDFLDFYNPKIFISRCQQKFF